MRLSKLTLWVSPLNYQWARARWPRHQVKIDTYISNQKMLVTKRGFSGAVSPGGAKRAKGTQRVLNLRGLK